MSNRRSVEAMQGAEPAAIANRRDVDYYLDYRGTGRSFARDMGGGAHEGDKPRQPKHAALLTRVSRPRPRLKIRQHVFVLLQACAEVVGIVGTTDPRSSRARRSVSEKDAPGPAYSTTVNGTLVAIFV
jgi:hypothetical protein